ncbi:hypothetical protein OIU77_013474 [Salix suchowensis]|uniref:RING-type domain-containing protein n=1 Tax=Salix suchowensis TaxID=1278906 RepID=A0ABQ8ZUC6_9ROSI|nr:hypothetical protein OIU77_013474 [Salix suchowensis]
MSKEDEDSSCTLAVVLLGIGSAALVITIYHCTAMRRFRARATQQLPRQYGIETMGTQSSVESSKTQLIPAIKFRKGHGLCGCRSRDQLTQDQILPQDSITGVQDLPGSFQNSIASLIPTCKYTDDIALVSKSEDVACAVCLNEFRDGEEVKVLPECLHTFHVSCIDMWLFSHSNCPLCRTDMGVSSPAYHQSESHTFQLPDSGEPQRAI